MAAKNKITNDTLTKRNTPVLIFKKIKDKSPFQLLNGKEVILKFNPDIKGIDKLFKNNIRAT